MEFLWYLVGWLCYFLTSADTNCSVAIGGIFKSPFSMLVYDVLNEEFRLKDHHWNRGRKLADRGFSSKSQKFKREPPLFSA